MTFLFRTETTNFMMKFMSILSFPTCPSGRWEQSVIPLHTVGGHPVNTVFQLSDWIGQATWHGWRITNVVTGPPDATFHWSMYYNVKPQNQSDFTLFNSSDILLTLASCLFFGSCLRATGTGFRSQSHVANSLFPQLASRLFIDHPQTKVPKNLLGEEAQLSVFSSRFGLLSFQ